MALLYLLFLFLFGCSSQDNKSNNHSTDDARLEPVEQAYDGCDKLLGSDHGSFKLPKKISKMDYNKVYSLSCNTLKSYSRLFMATISTKVHFQQTMAE